LIGSSRPKARITSNKGPGQYPLAGQHGAEREQAVRVASQASACPRCLLDQDGDFFGVWRRWQEAQEMAADPQLATDAEFQAAFACLASVQ
jgi:hypothetical protein